MILFGFMEGSDFDMEIIFDTGGDDPIPLEKSNNINDIIYRSPRTLPRSKGIKTGWDWCSCDKNCRESENPSPFKGD